MQRSARPAARPLSRGGTRGQGFGVGDRAGAAAGGGEPTAGGGGPAPGAAPASAAGSNGFTGFVIEDFASFPLAASSIATGIARGSGPLAGFGAAVIFTTP